VEGAAALTPGPVAPEARAGSVALAVEEEEAAAVASPEDREARVVSARSS
jgi:hypothetical protein